MHQPKKPNEATTKGQNTNKNPETTYGPLPVHGPGVGDRWAIQYQYKSLVTRLTEKSKVYLNSTYV